MKANELRIGNLVCDIEQKEVDKIVGIEEKRVSVEGSTFAYTPIDKILPIELTEEWLIKFGFEIKGDGIKHSFIGENPVTFDWMLKLVNVGTGWFYRNGFHKLEYVHQLQNLYFALTGEELKQIEL